MTYDKYNPMSETNPQPVFNPGVTPKLTANFTAPIDPGSPQTNTVYTAGDVIANSRTGSEVVPMTFSFVRDSGRIFGARCVVTPATGNLVISGLDFDLLLFRPATDIPFAAGSYIADNSPLLLTAAALRELVAVFRFASGSWRNPAGTFVAGITGHQSQPLSDNRALATFDTAGLASQSLIGLVQVLAAWPPGAILNRFDFAIDVDLD